MVGPPSSTLDSAGRAARYRLSSPRLAKPPGLILEGIVAWVAIKERLERRYESADGSPRPWIPMRRGEDQTRMAPPAGDRRAMQLDEVGDVLGDDYAPMQAGVVQEFCV